jgi:hypothetical protein
MAPVTYGTTKIVFILQGSVERYQGPGFSFLETICFLRRHDSPILADLIAVEFSSWKWPDDHALTFKRVVTPLQAFLVKRQAAS